LPVTIIPKILILAALASLIVRIVLVDRVKGRTMASSILGIFGGIFSITYLFPLILPQDADFKMRKRVKAANGFLYLFFIFFAALILYGVIVELPRFI
jgi:hypothetical protein